MYFSQTRIRTHALNLSPQDVSSLPGSIVAAQVHAFAAVSPLPVGPECRSFWPVAKMIWSLDGEGALLSVVLVATKSAACSSELVVPSARDGGVINTQGFEQGKRDVSRRAET